MSKVNVSVNLSTYVESVNGLADTFTEREVCSNTTSPISLK